MQGTEICIYLKARLTRTDGRSTVDIAIIRADDMYIELEMSARCPVNVDTQDRGDSD